MSPPVDPWEDSPPPQRRIALVNGQMQLLCPGEGVVTRAQTARDRGLAMHCAGHEVSIHAC